MNDSRTTEQKPTGDTMNTQEPLNVQRVPVLCQHDWVLRSDHAIKTEGGTPCDCAKCGMSFDEANPSD